MTNVRRLSHVFWWMILEEWRMHTSLFGQWRFALFPLLMLGLSLGGSVILTVNGASLLTLLLGLHVLILLFGIQTGTIGFVSQDTVENLLGDKTLLMYSGRSLPVSKRLLVAAFILKDALYYSGLFLLPIAFGSISGPPLAHSLFPDAIYLQCSTCAGTPIAEQLGTVVAKSLAVWASSTLTFLLGITFTLFLTTISIDRPDRFTLGHLITLIIGVVAVVGGGVFFATTQIASTPLWHIFLAEGVGVIVFGGIGIRRFTGRNVRAPQTTTNQYQSLTDRLPAPGDPTVRALLVKTLLDVNRSSGGVMKVAFSSGLIAAVALALVEFVSTLFQLAPFPAVVYGAILGLTAFPTYSWVTRFDSVGTYLRYPVRQSDVYTAKWYAFLALEVPLALGFFFLLTFTTTMWTPVGLVIGGVTLLGLMVYFFGLLTYLTGFDPEEFLFNTVLFLGFSIALMIVLIPILMVGMFAALLPLTAVWAATAYALLAGLVGYGLFTKAD